MEGRDNEGISFWKKNTKTVPGRPSPTKKDMKQANRSKSTQSSTSFQAYQASVSDAWEIGDDDLLVAESQEQISKRWSETAAVHVSSANHNTIVKNRQVPGLVANADSKMNRRNSDKHPHIPGRPQQLKLPLSLEDCESKLDKFQALLNCDSLDLSELCELSWSGVPVKARPTTWRLLSGYLPLSKERREQVLSRKRADYWNLVQLYNHTDETYQDTYRQIHIDIPRMNPVMALFQQSTVQQMFERILFIWAIRHPASGYVQGINDLVTPFYIVFLQEFMPPGQDFETYQVDDLSKEARDIIEADSFWCLSKFLDGIQDNYVFAQLGIQEKVNQLKELIHRVDGELHKHLQDHGVDYLQFSFRWMNNLLTREIPLHCTIRLWDTYLAESDKFASFQLYVCAAFLLYWKRDIMQQQDFQGLMILLQNLPTRNWTNSHISIMVAEAYRLKYTFADAPNHLQSTKKTVTTAASER